METMEKNTVSGTHQEKAKKMRKLRRWQIIVSLFGVAIIVWGVIEVVFLFLGYKQTETSNDAQIEQYVSPVNLRASGYINKIYFTEHQQVRKGDTLAVIEDAEFVLRVAQAEADYQNAITGKHVMTTGVSTTRNNVAVSVAGLQEAKVLLDNAERDYLRYRNLFAQKAVTRQQYDRVETTYLAAKARYELLSCQKKSASLVTLEQSQRLGQTEVGIKVAEAALALARINLSYTVIVAPCDGITGRKNIQEGQLVQAGQTLLHLINEQDKWIVANYKETQLRHIIPGCTVEIEVDAVPNVIFKGKVCSVSQATGASLSLLPQDNSAGNFVKVEQRVPVKIEFSDENDPEAVRLLRAGMNVECTICY